MPIYITDYDYELPINLIAQTPANPRESAKLMIIDRTTGKIMHKHISDLPDFLNAGDVLVVNNSKVFKARLHGTIILPDKSLKNVEIFLVRPAGNDEWLAIGKPGKKLVTGTTVTIADGFTGTIVNKNNDGTFTISFHKSQNDVIRLANKYGAVPVPPYIKTIPAENEYQTSYAKIVGSVAAPTAGFHLTPTLLEQIKSKGVTVCEITLHVGLGTFMPVKTKTIEEHLMHSEWISINENTAEFINTAKLHSRRVIAIGTTAVRTLETVAAGNNGKLVAFSGDSRLFITPGFKFHIVDGMLTNFHLPKSTLLMLVSAFAGKERIFSAYKEAIANNYRFFSFGDAMFII
jgi:S-adenosylmethionine:tRNA ribosyltransferase-isomerase